MGTEAVWIPLVASALGAGASYVNTTRTAGEQDQAAAEGIRRQGANQREANSRINRVLTDAQASRPEDERADMNAKYLETVQRKMAQARSGLMPQGISSAFDAEANAAAGQQQGLAENVAGLMARIDAPGLQRQQEAASYGNLGMDLDRIGGNVQGEDFLTRLRVGGVRRNPWLDAAAAGLQGWGSTYGSTPSSSGSGNVVNGIQPRRRASGNWSGPRD